MTCLKIMNNLYVSTTFIKNNQKIKIALDILKSAGIKNVELGSNHIYESNYDYIKKYNFNFLVHNYFPIPKENFGAWKWDIFFSCHWDTLLESGS